MKSWSQAQIGKKSAMSFVGIRVNAGYPYIVVEYGDYMKNAELYLINCIDLFGKKCLCMSIDCGAVLFITKQ
ncbi:hypothetical protein [Bacillus coahuilensis]|uniref:hypothetical protein n=1 Tax=Bacillus coahuilensis TaxID=408580 RepID=UPI00075173A1|nr:hypothetical protein [Bacillus coahuilensis]